MHDAPRLIGAAGRTRRSAEHPHAARPCARRWGVGARQCGLEQAADHRVRDLPLELVRSRAGITIPDLAQQMGINQNYLYRVLPALQKDRLVRKEGRGWHPREAA